MRLSKLRSALVLTWLLLVPSLAYAQSSALSFVHEGVIDAPSEAVWNVWATADGYRRLGPALADIDLRVGGLIRSKYQNTGTLADADAIYNRILAFEPGRMIAFAIDRPPVGFPFKDAWKHTWTVVTLTPINSTQTHLRIASLGFGNDEEALKMRQFFEGGNAATLKLLQDSFKK